MLVSPHQNIEHSLTFVDEMPFIATMLSNLNIHFHDVCQSSRELAALGFLSLLSDVCQSMWIFVYDINANCISLSL